MQNSGRTGTEPSRDIESRDAIGHLRRCGYSDLLEAIAETATTGGRINKSAVAARLNLTRGVVAKMIEEMRELLE